jgi:ParB family transcriptional regulator, chromosome partitioning protein
MIHLPLAAIDAEALPRDRSTLEPEPLAELAHSIATTGLRMPVEVWRLTAPRPGPDGGLHLYGLISGYRRLHACAQIGLTDIPAFLRTPASLPDAMAAMVAENDIRADTPPWDKGLTLLRAVEEGLFDTVEAAARALHPSASRQKQFRYRSYASVVEALSHHLTTPERLTARQMDRLASALRGGFTPLIQHTLSDHRTANLRTQWEAILPLIIESGRGEDDEPATPTHPGRPRRMLQLKQGLTIRREMTRSGWILRFSGPEAKSDGLIDDVLDEVERMFQRGS